MVLGSTVEMLNTFSPAPMAPERGRRSGKRATGGRETQEEVMVAVERPSAPEITAIALCGSLVFASWGVKGIKGI